MRIRQLAWITLLFPMCAASSGNDEAATTRDTRVAKLAAEVRDNGWIVFGARSKQKDWDLYIMRPDGLQRRNITNTPNYAEAAPRFSPDGKRMLYRRLPRGSIISHDLWGFQGQLVIAKSDGSDPVVMGRKAQYPWACWGPKGKRIACLGKKGITIIDLAEMKVIAKMKRKGFYQQLFWSPDGKWFCGVANYLGRQWTIGRMKVSTGELNAVSVPWACTPDWLPGAKQIIYSHNARYKKPEKGKGWTQLWIADGDGENRRLVFAQELRHVYGGGTSPDGKYVLMTISTIDGGLSEWSGAPMALMRLSDAPTIGGTSKNVRKTHPDTKDGPLLKLPVGWEPHWTFAEILPLR